MSVIEVINKNPMTLSGVSEALDSLQRRDEELNFRAKRVREYVDIIKPISLKDAEVLEKKITALDIPRIRPNHIIKLIDIRPQDMDSLKVLFSGENITIKDEDLQKILAAIKE